ncbi:MAG: c-type cytochrome [Syntrophales bacterium]|nr:c-type cytochrome [Syntrophales bacterium]
MKSIVTLMVAFIVVCIFAVFLTQAGVKPSPGEEAFVKHCAVCHDKGGNIINAAKTLQKNVLTANGIKTPADIVKNMRNPGPAMTQFDKQTVDDKTAKAIAEYILKTFK